MRACPLYEDSCSSLTIMASEMLNGKIAAMTSGRPVSIVAPSTLSQAQYVRTPSASSTGNLNLAGGKCSSIRVSRRSNTSRRSASTIVCASRPHKVALLGMQQQFYAPRISRMLTLRWLQSFLWPSIWNIDCLLLLLKSSDHQYYK